MTRDETNPRVSDWTCERYILGELDDEEMDRVRRLLEHDESLRARIAELERSNEEVLRRHPAAVVARQIERKLGAGATPPTRTRSAHAWLRPSLTWAPVAAVAIFVALLLLNPGSLGDLGSRGRLTVDSTTRVKGPSTTLELYRRTPGGSERLDDGAHASEHDLILIHYRLEGEAYGFILSLDGRGVVTTHFPDQGNEAALMPAGPHSLDHSYELDDAPLWEIFLLATSAHPFAKQTVVELIDRSPLVQHPGLSALDAEATLRSLALPETVSLSLLTLIKENGDDR